MAALWVLPSPKPRTVAGGRGRFPGPRMAAVRASSVPWAPYGGRGDVVGFVGLVWLPWGRDRCPGLRMVVVGPWPVLWAQYDGLGGVASPLGTVWMPWGSYWYATPVWPPWGRGRSPGPRMAAVGAWPVRWAPYGRRGIVAGPVRPVWPPWRCDWFTGSRIAAVGAWPVPWALYGCRGGVVGPLGPVWLPWGRGLSLCHVWPLCGLGRSPGPLMVVVEAWPISWAPYDCHGCVASPLGLVWPPCGRGRSPGPLMAAIGLWSVS